MGMAEHTTPTLDRSGHSLSVKHTHNSEEDTAFHARVVLGSRRNCQGVVGGRFFSNRKLRCLLVPVGQWQVGLTSLNNSMGWQELKPTQG